MSWTFWAEVIVWFHHHHNRRRNRLTHITATLRKAS